MEILPDCSAEHVAIDIWLERILSDEFDSNIPNNDFFVREESVRNRILQYLNWLLLVDCKLDIDYSYKARRYSTHDVWYAKDVANVDERQSIVDEHFSYQPLNITNRK